MPTFWKDTAGPGTFQTPQGELVMNARFLRSLLQNGKRMLAKGLPIPIPAAHQKDFDPNLARDAKTDAAKKAALADFNRGFVIDYRIKDGMLQSKLDIPDPEQAKRLKTEVRYVSPQIRSSFKDGDGEVFGPCIAHVALTPQPVWHRQKPFGDPEPPTALTASLGFDFVQLSLESYSMSEDAAEPPPPEKKQPPVDQGDDDEGDDDDVGSEDGRIDRIKALLQQLDVALPPHTTSENFEEHIEVALTALVHMRGGDAGADGSKGLKEEKPPGTGYMMSLTPEAEARIKTLEDDAKAEKAKNKALIASLTKSRREQVAKRIDMALECGMVKPERAKVWKEAISTFDFAIDGDGNAAASDVEKVLDVLEADYGQGAAMSLEDRTKSLGLREMSLPAGFADGNIPERYRAGTAFEITKEQAKQLAEKQLARTA